MICENLKKNIALLPNEICIKILSYTYSPQSPQLCEDIRDYCTTLSEIYSYYSVYVDEWDESELEEKYWLINDIYNYINGYYPICLGYRDHFYRIINRSYTYHYSNKKLDFKIDHFLQALQKKGIYCEINIIWGLLTPEERNHFIDYYIKSIDLNENHTEEEDEDWDF